MNIYHGSCALFLGVLASLTPDTRPLGDHLCPIAEIWECTPESTSVEGYANIYSRTYCMNFMCDTKTNGGGWIVIQRRVYRDTYFNRTWQEYKHGFGAVCDDYWLGNENIYLLTSTGQYELRIGMEFRSVRYFAEYREFYIDSESDKYKLHLNNFTGNVKDEFIPHSGMKFSTPDSDNDLSNGFCAGPNTYNTGWWFRNCHFVSLNGHFHKAGTFGASVIWESLTTDYSTLSSVEMKIRKITDNTVT
ncbi:Ryncolin-4 [Bulinus truncatus]|nr:Ryncolin-4 [Bulinus truncatus]